MIIKASKVMAAEIAKQMQKLGVKFEEISCIFMSQREYIFNVGDRYLDDCDYDWNRNKYKVIRIVYPYEYYAMPNYLSTIRLNELFKTGGRTLDGFMEQIKREIEI